MIDPSQVTNAVLAVLRAAWPATGDGDKPVGVTGAYAVLEHPPGPGGDGDMGNPERHLIWRCRIRAVGGDRQAEATAGAAREQAEFVAYQLRSALMNRATPIVGAGWKVSGRSWVTSGGVDLEGTVANAVDEYELWCVPA